jgi:hypothetical protein
LVPVPCVFVFVPVGVAPLVGDAPGEAATVGDVLAPTVEEDVGDGKIVRVALGEGEGLVVGLGEGVGLGDGEGVGDGEGEGVGDGEGDGLGEGVLVSVGVTSSGV